ncbi:hypothetical protein C3464_00725 [Serratia marcescens]|nr:hypothetical protein C3464_00725 [Serratia marcescens]
MYRFYQEKWWDKRATAYLELIDVLYDFKEDYGVMETHEQAKCGYNLDGKNPFPEDILSQDDEVKLWERMLITHDKLKKIKGLGPLVFTDVALEKVSRFIKRDDEVRRMAIGDEIDNVDAYSEMKASADDLYNEFKTIAIVELKLKSAFKSKLDRLPQWIFTQYIRAEHEYRKNLQ